MAPVGCTCTLIAACCSLVRQVLRLFKRGFTSTKPPSKKDFGGLVQNQTRPLARPAGHSLGHLWPSLARGLKSRPTVGALRPHASEGLRNTPIPSTTKSTDTRPTWPDSEVDPAGNRRVPMARPARPKRPDNSPLEVDVYLVALYYVFFLRGIYGAS